MPPPAEPPPDPAYVAAPDAAAPPTRAASAPRVPAGPPGPRPKNPAGRHALGDVVRELRRRRGWSQERLAMECGYDRAYVGQLERGERWPTVEAIWYVLAALGADWTEFGALMHGQPALRAAPVPREGRPTDQR